jgi:glycosyltransferase involved in cell wall biosynthesis
MDEADARLLFTCGREPSYTRNDVLLRALRPHYQLIEVTSARSGSLIGRMVRLLPRLVYALTQPHELVLVGFYGHPLVWLARRLSRRPRRPILFDAFVMTHDTLVGDRASLRPHSLGARLALWLDKVSARAADHVLLDTDVQAQVLARIAGLPPSHVSALFVGCNEDRFHPAVVPDRAPDGEFQVLYYGTYQPLHGMETVVRAARLLSDVSSIHWRIIGRGQTYPEVRRLADSWRLSNIEFQSMVPYARLPSAIASADICLGGPFGTSDKARRVITGKTFQFLAMRKPVIVADTPANRELLVPGESAAFVPLGDADALAETVWALYRDRDRRRYLANAGHARYVARASEAVLGEQLRGRIAMMLP